MNNDVVIYQSADGLVKIEAMIDPSNETIWATQKAMASLLGVDRTVITRHLSNIFKDGELDKEVVCAKFAQTTPHGAMSGEMCQGCYYQIPGMILFFTFSLYSL